MASLYFPTALRATRECRRDVLSSAAVHASSTPARSDTLSCSVPSCRPPSCPWLVSHAATLLRLLWTSPRDGGAMVHAAEKKTSLAVALRLCPCEAAPQRSSRGRRCSPHAYVCILVVS